MNSDFFSADEDTLHNQYCRDDVNSDIDNGYHHSYQQPQSTLRNRSPVSRKIYQNHDNIESSELSHDTNDDYERISYSDSDNDDVNHKYRRKSHDYDEDVDDLQQLRDANPLSPRSVNIELPQKSTKISRFKKKLAALDTNISEKAAKPPKSTKSKAKKIKDIEEAPSSKVSPRSTFQVLSENIVAAGTLENSSLTSRFIHWKRSKLIDLLVENGVELRNESSLPIDVLRDRAELLFKDRPMPKKPVSLSKQELERMNKIVSKVQNIWILKIEKRRLIDSRQQYTDETQDYTHFEYGNYEDEANDDEEEDDEAYGPVINEGDDATSTSILTRPTAASSLTRPPSSNALNNIANVVSSVIRRSKAVSFLNEPEAESKEPDTSSKNKGKQNFSKTMIRKALQYLDAPWEPPSWEKAKQAANFLHPRFGGKGGIKHDYLSTTTGRHCCIGSMGEQCDLFVEGQISEFAVYGPGVTNYFKFLKWCAGLFLALALVSYPSLMINVYGPKQFGSIGLSYLSATTLGNLAPVSMNSSTEVNIPFCKPYGDFTGINCHLQLPLVATINSWIEIGIGIVFLIAIIWLKIFERYEDRQLNQNTLFASRYSLVIKHLPKNATEEELVAFAEELVGETYPIAQFQVAYDNEEMIKKCSIRGDLIHKKRDILLHHRYEITKLHEEMATYGSTNTSSEGFRSAVFGIDSSNIVDESMRDERPEQDNEMPEVRDLERQLAASATHHDLRIIMLKEKLKLLRDQFWINIRDIEQKIRDISQEIAELDMITQVPLALLVTYNDDVATNIVMNKYNQLSSLQYYMGGHEFQIRGHNVRIHVAPEPSTIIWENLGYRYWERFKRKMATNAIMIILVFFSIIVTFGYKFVSLQILERTDISFCNPSFFLQTQDSQLQYVSENPQYVNCYCSHLSQYDLARESICANYFKDKLGGQFFTIFASFIILLVNAVLEVIVLILTDFEKHHSEDNKASSCFQRLFLVKFVNTGGIFLFNSNTAIIGAIFGVQSKADEFSAVWYNTIAYSIILVQMGNIFAAHGTNIYNYWSHHRRLRKTFEDPQQGLSQENLNKMHVGASLEIANSYAQVLSTFFVCLTFSSSLPILYWIGLVNFVIYYFVEKYLYIEFYRSPPRYSSVISDQAVNLVLFAGIAHLMIALWVFSDPTYFSTDAAIAGSFSNIVTMTTVNQRAFHSSEGYRITIMLFITFAITIVILMNKYVMELIQEVCKLILGHHISSFDIFEYAFQIAHDDISLITYTRAVQRNLIKGMASYNLLQNPKYKEAFGISWSFAVQHHHVGSILEDKGSFNEMNDAIGEEIDNIQRKHYSLVPFTPGNHAFKRHFKDSKGSKFKQLIHTLRKQDSMYDDMVKKKLIIESTVNTEQHSKSFLKRMKLFNKVRVKE